MASEHFPSPQCCEAGTNLPMPPRNGSVLMRVGGTDCKNITGIATCNLTVSPVALQSEAVCTTPKPKTLIAGETDLLSSTGLSIPVSVETDRIGAAKVSLPNRRCMCCATLSA